MTMTTHLKLQVIINHRCVVANVLDCDIVVGELEPLSHYYVHFRTNTLNKGMDPFTLPAMG